MARLEWTRPVSLGDMPTREMRDAVAVGDGKRLRELVAAKGPFRTHKAYTDLAYWRGSYYCIFRIGTAHWSDDGHFEIFVSEDSETWRLHRRIDIGAAARDPHFLNTGDRLVALLTVQGQARGKPLEFHCSHTEDGQTWSDPARCGPDGYVFWYPKKHKDVYYTAAYDSGHDVALFSSPDGLSWEPVATICQTETRGEGETCLHFHDDGRAVAIVRQGVSLAAGWADMTPHMCKVVCSDGPPYKDWREKKLKEEVSIEGQQCLEISGALYVCGRNFYRTPTRKAEIFRQTVLWRFEGDHFAEDLVFPGGGDTAYCGMLVRPDGKLLVSYYTGTRERADIMVSLVDVMA